MIGSENLRQFTSYLYEYDQGRRIRNVGFVRVQLGEETCIVHIHGKGLRMQGEKNLNIYLFYEEDGKCIGIWQGAVENVNPAINYRLTYTMQDEGMDQHYQQICGIVLKSNSGKTYSAVWEDHMADVEDMHLWEKEKEEPAPEKNQQPEFEYPKPERSDLPDKELDEAGLAGSTGFGDDVKAKEESEDAFACNFKKIQRSELAKLPRCEWKLANNSFLLHGYYNYKHLMFIREEDRFLLGVPGIYHPREARAAATFGFVEFIPMAKLDGSRAEPPDENETFGYWCRQVREPVDR